MLNGATMAFEEWNSQGDVLGHRIEWVVYDTACQFDPAQQAIRQAIDASVEFIIGPLCSDAAVAAAEEAESAGLLMISPTATHPWLLQPARAKPGQPSFAPVTAI